MKTYLPLFIRQFVTTTLFVTCYLSSSSQDSRKWATYLGGANDDYGYAVATDASGNVYLAGYTVSTSGIASLGSHKSSYVQGAPDAFLVKYDSSGVRLWGTYFGGSGDDQATSLAVDKNTGDVYMTGITYSNTGIASGGFDNSINSGSTANSDAFLVKFNSSGVLLWGTYYGGTGDDEGHALAVDALGNVYFAGQSASATTTQVGSGGHQNSYGGSTDAFLVKFNSSGVRQWGTYYGGGGFDCARGICFDLNNNIYLAGHTASISGISLNGFQNTNGGGRDAILAKFNTNGNLLWSTFYGGTGYEEGNSVSVDVSGNVYFSGLTSTTTAGVISTASSFQPNLGGGTYDAFLVKFSSDGTTRLWGTYYGGTGFELFSRVLVDQEDNVFLGGFTQSPGGISSGGFQNIYGGSNDGYIAKFTTAGSRVSSTYYGGTGIECTYAASIAADGFGNVYLAGESGSATDVASSGFQNTYGGGSYDAFLVKFGITTQACTGVSITTHPIDSTVCSGNQMSFRVTAIGMPSPVFQWRKNGVFIQGANSGTYSIPTVAITDTGSYDVVIKNSCDSTISLPARLSVNEAMVPNLGAADTAICSGDSTQICAPTIFVSYLWNNGQTGRCFYVQSSGNYRVTATDINGCTATSDDVGITVNTPAQVSISAVQDTLTATVGVSYQWYFEGVEILGATDRTHIALMDGNYSVEVTDANGCVARSANYYHAITGVHELNYELSLFLFPNPVTAGTQTVTVQNTIPGTLCKLLDVSGKLISMSTVVATYTKFDVSGVTPGIYLVQFGNRTSKLVIQ